MAEEPLPTDIQEGMEQPESLPANAEDRKAAKAMDKLDVRGSDEDAQPKKEMDLKALNDAMKNLGVGQEKEKPKTVKKGDAPKPLLKVDQADVAFIVSHWSRALTDMCCMADCGQMDQLDLSKSKATDLLRAHEADSVEAMTAWVTAPV